MPLPAPTCRHVIAVILVALAAGGARADDVGPEVARKLLSEGRIRPLSEITSFSPLLLVTSQRSSKTSTWLGATIQLRGFEALPSEWTARVPSALTMISRTASGRWAVTRPV